MSSTSHARAFTLLELLVVVAIIGVLIAILAPQLERARITACSQNVHQIAIALNTYASEFNNMIPTGPLMPSSLDAARPWSTIGSHQLWIAASAQYDGLGVLSKGGWIADARVFVCPSDADTSLKLDIAKILGGPADVYCSYAYRQLDQRSSHRLSDPTINTLGNPARAIALDWQANGPAPFAHNSHDGGEYLNVLYADGHLQAFLNDGLPFGANASDFAAMPASYLRRLDQVWINADWAETKPVSTAPQLP